MKLKFLSILCMLASLLPGAAQELPNVRINITGGYSYFLKTELSPEIGDKFIKDAAFRKVDRQGKWGLNVDGNAHYIFNNGLGVGAKYRFLLIDVSKTDLLVDIGDEHYGVLSLSERNEIVFLAPSLMYARWLDQKGRFLGTGAFSVGYTYLESSGTVDEATAMFDGQNVGFQLDLGVDYFLTRNISVGLSTGYFYTRIKEVRVNLSEKKTTLPEDSQPDLSNIKLNVSLSLHF
jgi:hypothetical protein